MEWYVYCLKNTFNFQPRGRRREFWMFTLFNILIIASILGCGLFFSESLDDDDMTFGIAGLYVLLTIIPSLASVVRRLHDTGRSGWWFLIKFVPIIGNIWMLILLVEDSQPGKNKWGDNPKGIGNDSGINQIGQE
ncbi:Uncharacterized membrane protein YhaH, DUF805 family [Tenacibaculum sp. MAR_2009_124]|uniref:DUF805 domain-containing protein n=1 Tax=Tenacibaculum sp. MAR_2009_124 TaxID=1250059 RepID=UPI0008959461|nr:DUF805 domain-containing protein [Tenacibaculum sp. MAR_2009_124]SEB42127.1 Uncharacterized membrane protein YhaH, DUF805 family [Tenacibaculum sp. MAR_2009_124]